ncbi:MAG: 5-formyltetrahydrofolate cyclo-ligase [Candidatus Peribacter sp.]|nr:5-formyltetrahydrofolate cyclo-ligase [Candidatus Peribacter sp.]
MPHISEQKKELRQAILERIQHMNEQARAAESRSIARRILEELPTDSVICAFFPMKTEPDIRPLLTEIIARGQDLFLPAFDGHALIMRRAFDLAHLIASDFGIPEPAGDAQQLDVHTPVIALIPGRAFDRTGRRLGRGNGGYDRWIAAHRAANAVSKYYGVGFDCQLVSAVPVEEHDAFLDGVFTGRGFAVAQK